MWSITDASLRVDVFGFDMRSRKVLGAISHVMPIIKVDPAGADDLRSAVERCVLAVELVAQTVEKIALSALVGRETKDTERRIAKSEAKNVMTAFLTAWSDTSRRQSAPQLFKSKLAISIRLRRPARYTVIYDARLKQLLTLDYPPTHGSGD